MARVGVALCGCGGRLRYWSCRRATAVVCAANFVVVLLVLRSLYSPSSIHFFSSSFSSGAEVRYTEEQINRVEESIRIREAAKPIKLVKAVRKLVKVWAKQEKRRPQPLPPEIRLLVADQILERMRALEDSSNVTQQRESVELWRLEKLQEIKQASQNASKIGMSLQEAELLKQVLESNWHDVMESIGLWIPTSVVNIVHDDKPENEPEEEEIIPGPPVPPECHAELHTDYDGRAVRWGLTHHKESAADCCQACLDQAKSAKPNEMKCNIWVYCPSEFGCYSPDIYEHKHQECWLKQAENPRVNFKDKYAESYRDSHPTAPVVVPWMSGVIS